MTTDNNGSDNPRDEAYDPHYRNGNAFIGCDRPYGESDVVLFGAPFDGTASYRPGARFACAAIRAESYGIETYSPYVNRDLSETAVCDGGDLELCFGNPGRVLAAIEKRAAEILSDNKIPFLIGGEHLVTLGALRAAARRYPGLALIHFDAHADLRDDYLGETLSHATVIRRCWDILGDGRIFQFGIRSGDKSEFEFAQTHTALQKFDFTGLKETAERLRGQPVYLTVDLDVLDSAVFPGTGTPEAGGVSFRDLLAAISLVAKLNIVALDFTELAPGYDQSGASTALCCKLLREMLLLLL